MEETRCIVCGGPSSRALLSKADDGRGPGPIFLFKCDSCGVVFLGSWDRAYDPSLYEYYAERSETDKTDIYSQLTEKRYEELLGSLEKVSPGRRILDVGCGQGHFVDVAARKGWDVLGIELSEPAVAICRRFGLPVERLDLFSPRLEASAFDVVAMFEVIEHVSSPAKFLRRAEELLRPGGLLYLTTPNFDSLDRRLLGSSWHAVHREHLTYFTPRTLRTVVQDHTALEVVFIRTRNLSAPTLRRLLPRRRTAPSGSRGSGLQDSAPSSIGQEEALRRTIESSRGLKALKAALNMGLDWFGCGADMVALFKKSS